MKVSYLILDYERPESGYPLLQSIAKNANHDKEVVYMCNGGRYDYAVDFLNFGLIDTLIIKKHGDGGGFGQTDLFRYCKTDYAFFVQVDNLLVEQITEEKIEKWVELLSKPFSEDYYCIDLNGDQSGRGVWTDRPHFINVTFFNNLGPFPNFGPGLDNGKWNEAHLQEKFAYHNYKIYHEKLHFADMGKWSVRQAGDGVFRHRCDTKELWVVKKPSTRTEVYPPLNDAEWNDVMAGNWPEFGFSSQGRIPEAWKSHSFRFWE